MRGGWIWLLRRIEDQRIIWMRTMGVITMSGIIIGIVVGSAVGAVLAVVVILYIENNIGPRF